ncbi:hypothetical protein [Nostoc sp.]|uniref:hypothetical protein n=1 Tax=Nostoc sp. TaxID=1180 RepID=UPI002FF8D66C
MNNWFSTTSNSSYSLLGVATNSNSIFPAVSIPTKVDLGSIPNVSPILVIQSYQLSI